MVTPNNTPGRPILSSHRLSAAEAGEVPTSSGRPGAGQEGNVGGEVLRTSVVE